MFKRSSVSRSTSRALQTGVPQVDLALERHDQVEKAAKAVSDAVQGLLTQVKTLGEKSAAVTMGFTAFYAGSPNAERARAFAEAHEKADVAIPGTLLEIAKEHITSKLDAYMQSLAEVRTEIATFKEKQQSFEHYSKKVEKLEEEKKKRESDGKVEKGKQVEKLTRNALKLSEAKAARDAMTESLLSRLQYFHDTRDATMEPIFKAVLQFQQEFFKQSSEALQITLPPPAPMSDINTTSPVSPAVATATSFDAQGNRLPTTPPSARPQAPSPPPPPSHGGARPAAPMGAPVSRPQPPPPPVPQPQHHAQHPAVSYAQPTDTPPKEDELVGMWFSDQQV